MAQGYQLSLDSVRRIQQRNREHDEMYARFAATRGRGLLRDLIVGRRLAYVGGSAISAASGSTIGSSTAGSGTVTFVYLDASNVFQYETDADAANITETVYNWTTTASGTNVLVWVGQDVRGRWFLLNEAC